MAAGAAVALAAILLAGFGGVPKAQPVAGAVLILGIAYLLSTNRSAIDRKTVRGASACRSSSRSSC